MLLQLTHIPPRLWITALLVICVATVNAAPAKLDNAVKTPTLLLEPPQYTEDNVETVATDSIGFGDKQQQLQQLQQQQQQQQQSITSIDSYGNPIESLKPIDTPDGRKVVSAQGFQFEIPNYASGITDIRKPDNELLPPHVGEFDILKQQQHDINALLQLSTNYDNIDQSTISTNNNNNNNYDNINNQNNNNNDNRNRNERRLNDNINFNDYNDATDQTDIQDDRFLSDDNVNYNYNNNNTNNNNNNNNGDDKLQLINVEKHRKNNNKINHDNVLTATAKPTINIQNLHILYPQETSTTMHSHTIQSLPSSQIYYPNNDNSNDNDNDNDNNHQLLTTTQISILDYNYELGKISTNIYDTSVSGGNSIPLTSINSPTSTPLITKQDVEQHSLYNRKLKSKATTTATAKTKNTFESSMPTQFSNSKLFSASTYVVPTISTHASPLSSGNFNYPNVPTDITVINRIAAKYQNPFPTTTLDPIAVAEPNQDDDQAFQGTNNLQEQQESVQVLINSANNMIPQYLLDLNDSDIGGPVDYLPTEDESTLKVISWDLVPPGEDAQHQESETGKKNIKELDTRTTTNENPTYNSKETQSDNQIYSTISNSINKYGQYSSTSTTPRPTPQHRRGTIHYTDYTTQPVKSAPRRTTTTTTTTLLPTRRAATTVRRQQITTTSRRPTTTTSTTTTTTSAPIVVAEEEKMEDYYRLANGDSYTLPPWLAGLDYEDLDVAVTFIVPTDNNEYNHTIESDIAPPLEPFNDLKNINLPAPKAENTTPATTTTRNPKTTRQQTTTTSMRHVTTPTPPRSYWIQTNTPTTTPKPRVSSSSYNNNNYNNNRFTTNQFAQSGIFTTSSTTTTRKPAYKFHTSFNTIKNNGQNTLTTSTTTTAPFSQETDVGESKQPPQSNPFLSSKTTTTTTLRPITTTTVQSPESTVDENENPFVGTVPSWLQGFDYTDLGPAVPFNYDPSTLEQIVEADLQAPYQFEEEKPTFLSQSQSKFPSNQIANNDNNDASSSSANTASAASTIFTSKVTAPSSLNTIKSTPTKDDNIDVSTKKNDFAVHLDMNVSVKPTFGKGEGGKVVTKTTALAEKEATEVVHSNPFLPSKGTALSDSRVTAASTSFATAQTAPRSNPTVRPKASGITKTYRNRFGGPPGILRPYDHLRG